jgi:hypothetical protein
MSESVSSPTMRAARSRWSAKITRNLLPFCVTCALVTTWPCGVTSVPLPPDTFRRASPCW